MSATVPKGLCIHCRSRVRSGLNGLALPGGSRAHRSCWKAALEAERAESRLMRRTVIAGAFVLLLAVLALAVSRG